MLNNNNHIYKFETDNNLSSHHINQLNKVYFQIKLSTRILYLSLFFGILILCILIYYFDYKNIKKNIGFLILYIIVICMNVILYYYKLTIMKNNIVSIIRLNKYMQDLLLYLFNNYEILNNNKIDYFDNDSILSVIRIVNIDYNQIQLYINQYLTILKNSIFSDFYKNINNIVIKIINHHNFFIIENGIQTYITNNYNNLEINNIFKNPYLYKYWVIASILNGDYLCEYNEYFDVQNDYFNDLNININKNNIKFYNKIIVNFNNITWIIKNIKNIAKYYDIDMILKYLYKNYEKNPKKTATNIVKFINMHNLFMKNIIYLISINKITFNQYIYLIFNKFFNKYPNCISIFREKYKSNIFNIYVLDLLQDIHLHLFKKENNIPSMNIQIQTHYHKYI